MEGLVHILELAGRTLARAEQAEADLRARVVQQDETIEHLRAELAEARDPTSTG